MTGVGATVRAAMPTALAVLLAALLLATGFTLGMVALNATPAPSPDQVTLTPQPVPSSSWALTTGGAP